jgi:serine/threonine-protein kinase
MGIVHRDVKPSNILVSVAGQVKVADFGIARALSEAQLTLPGQTLGSVRYLSPEQARGENVTPATDIYALGLVLSEMLSGRPVWGGDTAGAVAMARLTEDPPSPSSIRPDVNPALDGIVRRALARDPGQRFGSAGAFSTPRPLPVGPSGRHRSGRGRRCRRGGRGRDGSAARADRRQPASGSCRGHPRPRGRLRR